MSRPQKPPRLRESDRLDSGHSRKKRRIANTGPDRPIAEGDGKAHPEAGSGAQTSKPGGKKGMESKQYKAASLQAKVFDQADHSEEEEVDEGKNVTGADQDSMSEEDGTDDFSEQELDHSSSNIHSPEGRSVNQHIIDIGDEDEEGDEDPLLRPSHTLPSVPSRITNKKPSSQATTQPILETLCPPSQLANPPTKSATTFAALGLDAWLARSLANMAIQRPTSIQTACIPPILQGRDCIGGSRTGTGKTVAFAAPILQQWARDPSAIFAVVLTPTRELALQILEQFRAIAAPHGGLRALLVTGGADMRPQAIELARSPDLVIATPGRLADHIRSSGEDTVGGLRRVRFLVLDEADRLLDARAAEGGRGSMLPDVDECLSALSPVDRRQTLLFTATVTSEVRALRDMPPRPGREPPFVCEVSVAASKSAGPVPTIDSADGAERQGGEADASDMHRTLGTTVGILPASLDLSYVLVPVTHREHYLHVLLTTDANATRSVIVFCNRTTTADYLHHLLRLLDYRVTSLHSRLPQRQRTDNLARFRASAARVLVATDVAARGLDVPEVALVVNYDIPRDPTDFVHRVGRTARAGRAGLALSLVGQRDVDCVLAIEAHVRRTMRAWAEDGVSLDTRVVRDALRPVSERKREALLEIEERRDVGGRRKGKKISLRAFG